ncbi:MAG: hypothetical protein ACKO1O_07230 [Erythrobacter sp.]
MAIYVISYTKFILNITVSPRFLSNSILPLLNPLEEHTEKDKLFFFGNFASRHALEAHRPIFSAKPNYTVTGQTH